MRDDLDERLSLSKKIDRMISLGLWSDVIPQPDGQILERIHRLNSDIKQQIFDLYIPENQQELKINQIKQDLYQERNNRSSVKVPVSPESKAVSSQYLGKGVSSWLDQNKTDDEKLRKLNLPILNTLDDLAELVDTDSNRLKWLIFHEEYTTSTHYDDFVVTMGKKHRNISKPKPHLRSIQNHVKSKLLDKIKFPSYITGFVENKNILDNAKEHLKSKSLVTIDIKDFFENITFNMVRRAFKELGYSGQVASYLALVTTKQEYNKVEIGDLTYWNCSDYRYLPQGSPTSPLISNLVGSRFDKQLFRRAKTLGFKYTRYADDLTFSTNQDKANHRAILYMARKTLELYGFHANPNKTKILFNHNQMKVTGININDKKASVPRKWRRNLRAAVHQFRFIKDKEKKEQEYLRIMGSIQHLKLTHAKKAKQYEIEVNRYYQIG